MEKGSRTRDWMEIYRSGLLRGLEDGKMSPLQQTRKVVVANLRGVRKGREHFVVVDEGMRMRFGVCCGIFSLSRRFMNEFIDNKKRITDGESRVEVLMN